MNCQEARDLLGSLSDELSEALRSHLEGCSSCSAEWERIVSLDAGLRNAILQEPIDTSRLDARIRERIAPPVWRWVGAAAAVVLVGCLGLYRTTRPEQACLDAAFDHHREVVEGQRRTWRSDPGAIEALAAQQGIALTAFSRLSGAGLRLERAKICRLDGRVFLHLVYSSGDREVSVYLRHEEASPQAVQEAGAGRERVAYFDAQGLHTIVVADASAESVRKIAHSLLG
jgi:anti-sigma factor RsiW